LTIESIFQAEFYRQLALALALKINIGLLIKEGHENYQPLAAKQQKKHVLLLGHCIHFMTGNK
jgi:hypothetical protein